MRTLTSFLRYNSTDQILISEDSADHSEIQRIRALYPSYPVSSGLKRLGLMRSIDRLYSGVRTAHIFHLEDDWEFTGTVDWAAAIEALETNDNIANVCVRSFDEIKEKYRSRSISLQIAGSELRLMRGDAHPEFFGWSSNPGLIKTDLYRKYAPFGALLHDQMSARIKRDGRRIAYLLPGVARHIGTGRNTTDPTLPPRPKSRPAKWLRAFKKKLYYAGLRQRPF